MAPVKRSRADIDWPEWLVGRGLLDWPESLFGGGDAADLRVEQYEQDGNIITRS